MVRYNTLPLVDREKQSSDDAVFQEDLPTKGGLSGIDLIIRDTNGATSNLDAFLPEVLEEIAIVVNGDEKRYSLSGEEAFRHAWMRDGRPPTYKFSEQAGIVQELHIPIQFGRFMDDPVFGLKLSQYQNAQLQIDYNRNKSANGLGATGFTAAHNFEISALLHITAADKEPAYRGLISTREVRNFTSAANGDEYVALPPMYPLVGIGIYAKEEGVEAGTNITHARLSLDNDARQPIRGRWEHHVIKNRAALDVNYLRYNLAAKDADTPHTHLGYIQGVQFQGPNIAPVSGDANLWFDAGATVAGDQITIAGVMFHGKLAGEATDDVLALTISNFDMLVTGDIGNYLYWPMGDRMLLDEVLKPGEWGDADVLMTQGNAGAYVGVLVEELRPN